MLRQARFILCCAGALLVYQTDRGGLFYAAAVVAFANLFVGQFICGTRGCQVPAHRRFSRDPVVLLHDATAVGGLLFCLLGVGRIGWF
ncbi:MAG: hypothetical protein HQL90_13580 [Magnetococcales bacterium]|nr:hypothetical protein [Magnetococcales bacterium]